MTDMYARHKYNVFKYKCIKCKHDNKLRYPKFPEPFRVRFFWNGKEKTLWMRKNGVQFLLV